MQMTIQKNSDKKEEDLNGNETLPAVASERSLQQVADSPSEGQGESIKSPEPQKPNITTGITPKISIDTSKMTLEEIKNVIRVKERERTQILEKIKDVNKARDSIKEQRDKLNLESSEIFTKASEIREKRDSTNKEIQELKATRQSVKDELRALSERERTIFENLKKDEEKRGGRVNARNLQKQIEELERNLETTPNLGLKEQEQLTEKIDYLSAQLGVAESSESIQRELREIRKRKSNLKGSLDDSWKQLNELVTASQTRHTRFNELLETGKKSKAEADKSHQAYLSRMGESRHLREKLQILKAELDILYPAMKEQQENRRKIDQSIKNEREVAVKDEKTAELRKKLSNKKALSMEEMEFLLDQGMIKLNREENQTDPKEN